MMSFQKLYQRTVIPFIFVLMLSIILSGCSSKPQQALEDGKINVVASFYPLYDFTSKIGGEHVNVINLVPTGVEPHDWSPKGQDMSNLSKADLFIYLGAGFEGWVDQTLSSLDKNSQMTAVEASHRIKLIPGTDDGHDHGHEEDKGHEAAAHDEHKDEHQDEQSGMDPHVWLSPVNAKLIAQNVKDALVKADAANQADYEANFKKLSDQLDELHNQYNEKLAGTSKKEIVVSHQSFGYLAHEYGLTQKSIMGLSADAEPTSKDMQGILKFIKDNQLKYIFFEELVSDKLARTLANDAGVETLVLNPIEGLTEEQVQQGEDYVSIMENNLNNLLKALQ
ncbi:MULTISPECIES: zinc ABC transporter substrate-binding protein [unclassified Paenibacillus]|uniref:metal ABC transporter solute-binding protein, Zn/Mn family n=1 Tax=unclassified Paenibacillus TaxID=185978 RepID=UPI001B410D1E|nr:MULTISPECIES: zinc ABC transporter substrate-binding protein [unclassified Paenibacillus]MBP1155054.1 zinc transport system substrate-binding protein [Paenibacillus sp. PvP091]MBP1169563.1 zinc transport system substrate-binding protein [Paenibacillus sp. PvR098]MBP2440591.1 zinc transport system substrate-binding protein [Paenibacillus sp. PvP052]